MGMTDMKTTVSIITVTYNSALTVRDTIESVLNQSYPPAEYIIVDGVSSDDTLSIVEEYRGQFEQKHINYIVISEKDKGIYDAMNKGIRRATGELIGMINSDDWYEPCALACAVRCYEEKGYDLFFADLRMHFPTGKTFIKHARNRKYATSRDWNHPTTFITADMYRIYQYQCNTIHDDYDLILRLKKNGAHVETVNEVLANFRMNGTSHEKSMKKAIERIQIKYSIYRDNGYSPFYLFECIAMEAAKLIAR